MNTGFVPILGIFFCVFHPTQGSKVMCQVPDGCVIPTDTSEVKAFITFDQVKNYLIPKPALCNRFISLRAGDVVIKGYPINIQGEEYERNSFTYNVVFLFSASGNSECHESAIVRFARMFQVMEIQSRFLSIPENIHEIDSVIEQMYQDLNSFSECQIPLGLGNKVNIKLFPISESPPVVRRYHVPVPTVRLNSLMDEHWDPTMERIIPFLNGINSVRAIADLAEADYGWTKQVISHLIHYDCVVIIGIFQFSNIYIPTPDLAAIATDQHMFHELLAFMHNPTLGNGSTSGAQSSSGSTFLSGTPISHNSSMEVTMAKLTVKQVFDLYQSFGIGQSVYTWYQEHKDILADVDVRRFIIFGIVKKLIMRVHAYPIYDHKLAQRPDNTEIEHALQAARLSHDPGAIKIVNRCIDQPMRFDDLCSGLRASRAKVSKLLRSLGEWTIINR